MFGDLWPDVDDLQMLMTYWAWPFKVNPELGNFHFPVPCTVQSIRVVIGIRKTQVVFEIPLIVRRLIAEPRLIADTESLP